MLVNGQTGPRLQARPGERERWRIVNASTARYLRLRLDGQQTQLLGIDSGRLSAPPRRRRDRAHNRQPRRPARHHRGRHQRAAHTALRPWKHDRHDGRRPPRRLADGRHGPRKRCRVDTGRR
ncbi:cupredoxin domain-containing protein [Pseudonocardia adelaidensis]|uniref:hypothetical protein n=1 Tax=Pseudonocardia adelaidensis TaxID=648754 RepID=UPI003CD0ABB4